MDVELVTSAGLTPFFSVSKSAAISGHTVSRELQSQSWLPAQKGQPLAFLPCQVRLYERACQLCTLPCGHSWQHHQMCLPLCSVVLSGELPFSLFLSWSHCSSKGCFAVVKVGCFCLVPSAFLPTCALAHLGHPVLAHTLLLTEVCHSCKQALHFQWDLMLLPMVTCSGDKGWFFVASQNSATCGAFVANALCWHIFWPEQ